MSYFQWDLSESKREALSNLRELLHEATINLCQNGAVSIWWVPLLNDERSDAVLLKFLLATGFKVKESLEMIMKTLSWRREFGIEELLEQDLGNDLDKFVFIHGKDKDEHPVLYEVYGEFHKRERLPRLYIQLLERSIRKLLDFSPGGVTTFFHVIDLRDSPKNRQFITQALKLVQDHYPDFFAKRVFINVPWWRATYTTISPFMNQRRKSKFVSGGTAKIAETLLKYISPEQIPTQYGGLSVVFCVRDPIFTIDDPAREINMKPKTTVSLGINLPESCIIQWEIRVVGREVTYTAKLERESEDCRVINVIHQAEMRPSDPLISRTFKSDDLGKIVFTFDNKTGKTSKLFWRYKVLLPYSE